MAACLFLIPECGKRGNGWGWGGVVVGTPVLNVCGKTDEYLRSVRPCSKRENGWDGMGWGRVMVGTPVLTICWRTDEYPRSVRQCGKRGNV